ncbi:MAG: hypothetical protein V2A58_03035 [Planctomycetota bacterium]
MNPPASSPATTAPARGEPRPGEASAPKALIPHLRDEGPSPQVALPAALFRDCAVLSAGAAVKARRFLDAVASEAAGQKERSIAELIAVHDDFGRESARIRDERYEPVRRDELLAQARADHLLRLRQVLERQNRASSDWILETSERWRAIVRPAVAGPGHGSSPEAGILAELLSFARRSYVRSILAGDDRREIVVLWRAAHEAGDSATCDLVADVEPERRPPELAAAVSDYRARRDARRRLERSDELLRWLQRERTVAHAVYDSVAETLARS